MHYYLAQQLVVLARDREGDGWMNLLFLVVLAVFWAVGGLAKAKANKMQQQREKDAAGKPKVKPSATGRAAPLRQGPRPAARSATPPPIPQQRPVAQRPHRPMPRPAPAAYEQIHEDLELEPGLGRQPVYAGHGEVAKASAAAAASVQPKFEEIAEMATDIEPLKVTGKATAGETVESFYLPELLASYDDPDKLKQAFLNLEILGRPVSLRESDKQIIGL